MKTEDGVYIGYQVFGDGPYDLVNNPGWLSNVDANWLTSDGAVINRELARRARVIMFDGRGFGISDRPSSLESLTLEKAMGDMRQVMDAAGSERAVVLRVESGAALSILFAASFPERVTGLVLQARR